MRQKGRTGIPACPRLRRACITRAQAGMPAPPWGAPRRRQSPRARRGAGEAHDRRAECRWAHGSARDGPIGGASCPQRAAARGIKRRGAEARMRGKLLHGCTGYFGASCPRRAAERKEYPRPSARLAGDGSPYPSARSHGYDTRLARHGCRGIFSGLVSTAAGGGKASARRHAQSKGSSASRPLGMRFPRPPVASRLCSSCDSDLKTWANILYFLSSPTCHHQDYHENCIGLRSRRFPG